MRECAIEQKAEDAVKDEMERLDLRASEEDRVKHIHGGDQKKPEKAPRV
jgi:hypothetical protein